MGGFFQLLPVSCEEYSAGPRSVPNANNVTLNDLGAVVVALERLVVAARTIGKIGNRVFVEA